MRKRAVLVFDPSAEFRTMIAAALSNYYEVEPTAQLTSALAAIRHPDHAAFLIDVTGGAEDPGMEFLRSLRAGGDGRVAVALSGTVNRELPARCYEAGAHAFVAKTSPVVRELRSLLPRLIGSGAIVRRRQRDDGIALPETRFRFGDAMIDPSEMKIALPRATLDVNAKEVGILQLFAERPGRLVRRLEILHHVWGPDAIPTSKSLDTYMTRLRRVFERGGSDLNRWVVAKPKLGWRIHENAP